MQKEILVNEVESGLEDCESIDIIRHLQKSEEDIENGRTISAEEMFNELREKYGY